MYSFIFVRRESLEIFPYRLRLDDDSEECAESFIFFHESFVLFRLSGAFFYRIIFY